VYIMEEGRHKALIGLPSLRKANEAVEGKV